MKRNWKKSLEKLEALDEADQAEFSGRENSAEAAQLAREARQHLRPAPVSRSDLEHALMRVKPSTRRF